MVKFKTVEIGEVSCEIQIPLQYGKFTRTVCFKNNLTYIGDAVFVEMFLIFLPSKCENYFSLVPEKK